MRLSRATWTPLNFFSQIGCEQNPSGTALNYFDAAKKLFGT